jgi:hypothetical protein
MTSGWFARQIENRRNATIADNVQKIELASYARRTFQKEMTLVRTRVRKGHSHQQAAAERNSATETMLSVVRAEGFTPYVLSPSPREANELGCRKFYGLADLRQGYRNDDLTEDSVIVMTDVDYYADMAEIISYGLPILAYTFQPITVAGPVLNGCFTISNNMIKYQVNGGKDVTHQIWNYSQDTVYTRDPVLTFWGTCRALALRYSGLERASKWMSQKIGIGPFGEMVTVSTIDQFEIGPDRNIVSIVPFAKCRTNLLPIENYGVELSRMNYRHVAADGKVFNMVSHLNKNGNAIVSLGEEGCHANVTLKQADLEMLRTSHQLQLQTGKGVNLSDTQRRSGKDDRHASIIHSFLQSELGIAPDVVHTPGQLARHYQSAEMKRLKSDPDNHTPTPGDEDEDKPSVPAATFGNPNEQGKDYAREYAPGPLTQTAVFPTESLNNEHATIRGRVDGPQTEARQRENITSKHHMYAKEFVELTVPDAGVGHPYPISHVEDQQQKPLQRARNDANRMHHNIDMKVKAFQKKEAYNAPNHPRNISTVPHGQNTRLASFTYAFKDTHLKKTKWYMPCHAPAEIAAAMQKLASESDEIVETDFSRFDGTFLRFMRTHVEFACYKRWVKKEHLSELSYLLDNELDAKARTRLGLKYNPCCSRLSGSALTTDGNCLCNAFTSYVANRESGMGPREAWNKIGLVYGDDGARGGEASDETLAKTASDLGFKLKVCNRARRGQPVSFLSRIFADPWTSPASVQSPARTLLKIHCTCDNDNNRLPFVGWAKTQAYLVTDSKTPLTGDWCRAYQRNSTEQNVDLSDPSVGYINYWAQTTENRNNSWPQNESTVWNGIVAKDLGISESELLDHITKLQEYNGPIEGLPRLTTNLDLAPKLTVVMDGEIHAGPISEQEPKISTRPSKKNEQRNKGNPKLRSTTQGIDEDTRKSKPTGNSSRDITPRVRGYVKPRNERSANAGYQRPIVSGQNQEDGGALPSRPRGQRRPRNQNVVSGRQGQEQTVEQPRQLAAQRIQPPGRRSAPKVSR